MEILIQIRDASSDREIREFTEEQGDNLHISHSTEESINILSIKSIQEAIVSLKCLRDAAILKYLNDYYPQVKITVIANKTFDDVISIFQKSNYSVIHEPLKLDELKKSIFKPIPAKKEHQSKQINN